MRAVTLLLAINLIAVVVAQSICPNSQYPLTVSTTVGDVHGTYYNGSRAFLGIPYAQPPIGNLRFALPVAATKSSTVIEATQWPNACYQAGVTKPVGYNQSEDCLYLNVFTPPCQTFDKTAKLPIMLFIHGGRYWTGYTEQFPGDLLAAYRHVIVVTIQYRLNIFGFQSFDNNTNIGLRDQQLAMKWAKDNAAAFGGDANSITIFGESAGASSVLYHLIVPSSYPYYNKAIMESSWQWLIPNLTTARQNTAVWAATTVGCNNVTANGAYNYAAILACLRAQPASKINPTTGQANFMVPVVDRAFINTLPLNSIKLGQYNKNAVITLGHNYDEGNFLAYSRFGFVSPQANVTNATYLAAVNKTLSVYLDQKQVNNIIAQYEPVRNKLGNWYGGAQIFGDYYIICGSILAAKYFSRHTALQSYIFNYSSPNYPAYESFVAASHGNELPYVFMQDIYDYYPFSPSDDLMSERMSTVWSYFAKYSFGFGYYPVAEYFGPNAAGFFDTRPYIKDICSIWAPYFQLY